MIRNKINLSAHAYAPGNLKELKCYENVNSIFGSNRQKMDKISVYLSKK